MDNHIVIYKENYSSLPRRFQAKIEQDIDFLVNAQIPGLKKIYLFGSCARGEVRSTSDIDLLILTDQQIKDRELAANIRWTLDEPKEGVSTDIVYMNEHSVQPDSVFKNVLNRDKKLILEVVK
ncbi:nucleotidyltransferase domain-containing protein [Faecalicatena sp. AGMB00832]|uniref:Nucleotidyltransferase domain-containing protein n=1 Tax=Faecalicatena faecalis TaxID=2726362 RepID=A0ABS6CZ01_9FIRM|nr:MULTISPECIES: nucleotidyltransferase domain-containing protein [Faecalicatena]MBU3874493.1 nucleotidyltransferase domain-containing protein [Faecalicatena faecalis]MCI6466563.1 nucleotidyltransferase domain-containing protein [Faecalicatena sp.]MDY5617938.1 nucleotidyltransferase domain-containing protein [Lachnospiraceae bacterium]